MPSMPVGFWGDDDGSRYRAAYFEHYPGVWRHGDWITITERGSCRDHRALRRHAQPRWCSGRHRRDLSGRRVDRRRASTAWSCTSSRPTPTIPARWCCSSCSADGLALDDETRALIRSGVRSGLSPRHVPDELHQVAAIPTTLSGKKLELPVKKILRGGDPGQVASRGALKDPAALDAIVEIAEALIASTPFDPEPMYGSIRVVRRTDRW